MKPASLFFVTILALAGCATGSRLDENQKLALYRAHAGEQVLGFSYLGRFDSWTDLGDRALAIWTRPQEAWLLELGAPCDGLDFATTIGLTSQTGRVSARFDDVLVHDGGGVRHIPCRIESIRPLDVPAIRDAERAAHAHASGAT